jgi:hypothetical protein
MDGAFVTVCGYIDADRTRLDALEAAMALLSTVVADIAALDARITALEAGGAVSAQQFTDLRTFAYQTRNQLR